MSFFFSCVRNCGINVCPPADCGLHGHHLPLCLPCIQDLVPCLDHSRALETKNEVYEPCHNHFVLKKKLWHCFLPYMLSQSSWTFALVIWSSVHQDGCQGNPCITRKKVAQQDTDVQVCEHQSCYFSTWTVEGNRANSGEQRRQPERLSLKKWLGKFWHALQQGWTWSEISQTQKNICHSILLIWGIWRSQIHKDWKASVSRWLLGLGAGWGVVDG